MLNQQNWSEKTASSIMERTPILSQDKGYNGKWTYDYGVILKGFQLLWEKTKEEKYFNFIKKNMDCFVQDDGEIDRYNLESYNIDNINTGKLLFVLYQETGEAKYKKAADLLYSQIKNHPRTTEGVFWHKNIYPHQIWLDGLYMGAPFYAEYALNFGEPAMYDDVVHQFAISYKRLFDPETNLLIHAYDEKKVQPWADPETGHSHNFWSRSIGWYLMAAVDTYELLKDTETELTVLREVINETLEGLLKYQDPESGTWYQVTNQPNRKGNYLEASGSSMFVYAMAKGIRLGVLDKEKWLNQMEKSYKGLLDEFVLLTDSGWVNLNKTCQVAGLGGAEKRDGSYTYYISEPIICNDQKGLGAFLQALIEAEGILEV